MATVKYFNGTEEIAGSSLWQMSNKSFDVCFPDTKGLRADGYTKWVALTEKRICERLPEILPVTRIIYRKANPSLHKCDARCTNAKGKNCECSCGGANHGSAA